MTITKVDGFIEGRSVLSENLEGQRVTEVCQVITDDAKQNWESVRQELPTFGASASSSNPLGISFTLRQSRHPYRTDFIFVEVSSMTQSPENGNVWLIEMVYENLSNRFAILGPESPQTRRDQQVERAELNDPVLNKPIVQPWSRPPILTTSTRTTQKSRYFKEDGTPFKHTNGLVVTNPISVDVKTTTLSWSFNTTFALYDRQLFENASGSTNDSTFVIPAVSKGVAKQVDQYKCICTGFNAVEKFETPGGSTEVFHYMTVTFTINVSNLPYDRQVISRHTMCRDAPGSATLIRCKANDAEDVSSPWPLLDDGTQVDPADLATVTYDDLGKIDTGYPVEGNFIQTVIDKFDLKVI